MDFLVHHMLRHSVSRSPDREAIVHGDQRLTYSEFQERVTLYASALLQAGCTFNDRIGIFLPPGIPLAASIFATSMVGGIFVPIHHSLFEHQVEHIVRDCGIKTLISCKSLTSKVSNEVAQSCLENLFLVDDHKELVDFSGPMKHNLIGWALETAVNCESLDHNRAENDLAAILYTSGSTGLPKGVMLSHRNVVSGASIVSDYLGITDSDRILAALPFSFDAGLNQLTTSIQQGATIVLLNFMFAREIVAAICDERITGLAGVPPLWNLLVQDNSTLKKRQPEFLRYVTNTGGAVTPELLENLQSCLPCSTEIFLMYGLTEAFRSTYLPPQELARRPQSMGKAIPNSRIVVVREDGSRCDPGEVGELVHQGPTVAQGYWGNPDATDKVFRPASLVLEGSGAEEKVVFSGDLVFEDEDGFLYFVGRKDTLIKSSGFRVSPTEVEAGIMQTGLVNQAAVVGIPDPALGQKIVGFIAPKNQKKFDEAVLLTELAGFLPRHMLPRKLHCLDAFPRTSSGKIDYPLLMDRAKQLDVEGVDE